MFGKNGKVLPHTFIQFNLAKILTLFCWKKNPGPGPIQDKGTRDKIEVGD